MVAQIDLADDLRQLTLEEISKCALILSGLILLGAYLGGKLYLGAYFAEFGVNPSILGLSPQEVMFETWRGWGILLLMAPLVTALYLAQDKGLTRLKLLRWDAGTLPIGLCIHVTAALWLMIAALVGGDVALEATAAVPLVLSVYLIAALRLIQRQLMLKPTVIVVAGAVFFVVASLPMALIFGYSDARHDQKPFALDEVIFTTDLPVLATWNDPDRPGAGMSPVVGFVRLTSDYLIAYDWRLDTTIIVPRDQLTGLQVFK